MRYIEVFDITNRPFNEQIRPVPSDFVKLRFHCIRMTFFSDINLTQNRTSGLPRDQLLISFVTKQTALWWCDNFHRVILSALPFSFREYITKNKNQKLYFLSALQWQLAKNGTYPDPSRLKSEVTNIHSRVSEDYSCLGYIFNGKLCFAAFPSDTTNGSWKMISLQWLNCPWNKVTKSNIQCA